MPDAIILIPNQPIVFTDEYECGEQSECYCQKYNQGDLIKLQFKQQPCGDDLICDGIFDGTSLGPELITNGSFTGNATGWTLAGFAYTGNEVTKVGGGGGGMQQFGIGLTVGKTYRVQFNITEYIQGVVTPYVSSYADADVGSAVSGVGSYTQYITKAGASDEFLILATGSFEGNIDNVSVVEILAPCPTTELVTNGTFTGSATDWALVGYTYSSDSLACPGGTGSAKQTIGALVAGNTYRVRFTIRDYVQETITPLLGGTLGTPVTTNGTYEQFIVCGLSAPEINMKGAGFEGTLDDVSIVDAAELTCCWEGDDGWIIGDGVACHSIGISDEELSSLVAPYTVGNLYQLSFTITGMTGGVLGISAGGSSFNFSANGVYTVYFLCSFNELKFIASIDFDGCVSSISSYLLSNAIGITLKDIEGNEISDLNLSNYTSYDNNYVTLIFDISNWLNDALQPLPYGKYYLCITDPCSSVEYCSNCIDYREEHDCAKLVDATCGCTAFGFDFKNDFSLTCRIPLVRFNPKYANKQTNFTNSAGDVQKVYASRDKTWLVKTDRVDEITHDALSTMLLCDSFSIEGVEYSYDDNEYRPKWNASGNIALSQAQFELQRKIKSIIYNNSCDCEEGNSLKERCCILGWDSVSSYKEIHDFEEWLDVGMDIVFSMLYARINGVDVLGFSPILTLTQPSSGVFVPDLIIDDVHNNNQGVGYTTIPITVVQNVTDWVNNAINDSRLKFIDNMSGVERNKDITFEVYIIKHFDNGVPFDDRYKYTEAGLFVEANYTDINDPFPNPALPYMTCVDI